MLIKLGSYRLVRKQDLELKQKILPSESQPKVEEKPAPKLVFHCCCTLTPKQFTALVGKSRLPFIKWYDALWLMQHNPNVSVTEIATKLEISWPTAQDVYKRIKEQVIDALAH